MIRATFAATLLLTLTVNVGPPKTASAQQLSFMGLGDLPGDGSFFSLAEDISPDGNVVVGNSHGPNGTEAYVWTQAGGMVGIGDLPGGDFLSRGFAVSGDGSVVAGNSQSGWSAPDYQEAFRWTAQTGMQGLGDFPGAPFKSIAWDVSEDGSTIVGSGYPGDIGAPQPMAFRWTQEEGMVELGDLPGSLKRSQAYAVSNDGSTIVGSSKSSAGQEAFRWTAEEGMVGLGDLPGGAVYSGASAVSADGSVIYGFGSIGSRIYVGFRWTAETGMVSLGPDAILSDISGDGTAGIGERGGRAYIWDEVHGQRLVRDVLIAAGIDMGDWTLAYGKGISADGRTVVGTGFHDGVTEAWMAHLPAPGVAGDFDQDGLTDLTDYAAFADCGCEPGGAPEPTPPVTAQQCLEAFDFDSDGDVDLEDFGGMQRAFTG